MRLQSLLNTTPSLRFGAPPRRRASDMSEDEFYDSQEKANKQAADDHREIAKNTPAESDPKGKQSNRDAANDADQRSIDPDSETPPRRRWW